MDTFDDLEAAVERLTAGAQIAEIQPILIEKVWETLSRAPRNEAQHNMVGVKLDPSLVLLNPEQTLALMTRYALLNTLVELGVLDEHMKDEESRKKVFTVASLLSCDKNDLAEAVAAKALRESPPDVRQKKKEELVQAGYDLDHLKLVAKFMKRLRDST